MGDMIVHVFLSLSVMLLAWTGMRVLKMIKNIEDRLFPLETEYWKQHRRPGSPIYTCTNCGTTDPFDHVPGCKQEE